jgi:transcriptional regulator with XRE-family HTH domain
MSRGKSLAYKPGAGASRDYWAIKRWLNEKGLTLTAIAACLGINVGGVSATIRGTRNTRKVLKWLSNNGCPASILSLPDDLKHNG